MFKDWNSVTFDARNNIVFENRNQAYGAYELRQRYNIRLTTVIGGVVGFAVLLWMLKMFLDRPKPIEAVEQVKIEQIDLTPPPPKDELPPPPPPPPPPPMVETVKFVPPVIKDDAKEEEPQKLQEDVKETNVSTVDQEGSKDLPPPEPSGPVEPAQPEIFTIVEEMPEPEGGMGAFYKYLSEKIQYPAAAREAGIQGKCFLRFVVNETGQITDIQIQKGVPGCPDCDREAIRVLKTYPKWKVGKQNGRPVKVFLSLPISFKMQ